MSSFLIIPLKKTQPVDFIKPLSNYIKNTFSGEVLNEVKDSLAELNQLRSNAVVRSLDKHETSLEVIQRYYDQLVTMEAKLPIAEDQIRVSLTWYDAFDKGSIFGSTKCALSNGAYERFCVLFNIGALFSQIASSQNHSSDDGLKTSAKYYQQSAGIFAYLKDNVYPVLQTLPTPDLAVSCLSTLSAIMVAQAQECIYTKASTDNMKSALIAKVAMQAFDYYQEAVRLATFYEVKGLWDKDWIPILQCKQNYFMAVAEYHQASVCVETGKYGEQVGRAQKADKYIKDAIKHGKEYTPGSIKTFAGEVNKLLTSAKKDNEFIYNDKVPTIDSLTSIGRATLAKALPFSTPMSSSFQDLFQKLVPMQVHQSLAAYDAAKAGLMNMEIGKMREATQFLNGILASLNLPAAIEDLSGGKCPQSVLDKAAELKNMGGLQSIDQMMENLPDLLSRNRDVLDETFRMMDEEERDDKQMRDHFKERWTRTPSAKLTVQLREEGSKYRHILDNATSADGIVKEKYNTHRRALEILSKSDAEITACLPKADASVGGAGGETVRELRDYMIQVEQLKKERETLEEEFKGASVDMQSKFLEALAADGYVDTERITNQNLEEVYGEYKTQVEENVEKQKQLIENIQSANERFVAAKQGGGNVNPRDQMLKDLAAAFDAFVELSANLKEGTKFYNDLTEILLKYQSKVNDLIFARKTEKDDLSKDLQQQAAKGSGAAPPSIPSHHQDAPRRPDRPPPPQQQQQAPVPAPRPAPQGPPPTVQGGAPPVQPSYNPNAPYPQQPSYMPQPGMYAPPGGYYAPPQPYMPPQYPYAQGGQPIPPYAQQPPYGQQPPMAYQGYPYPQQPQQQPPR